MAVGGKGYKLLVESIGAVRGTGNEFIEELKGLVRWCTDPFDRKGTVEGPELGGVCVGGVGEFFLPNPVSCALNGLGDLLVECWNVGMTRVECPGSISMVDENFDSGGSVWNVILIMAGWCVMFCCCEVG